MVSENRILARKINKAGTLWENRGALESRLSVLNQRLVDVIAMFSPVSPEDAKKFQLKQQQVIEKIVKGTGIRIKTFSWLPITSPFLHLIPVKMVGEGSPKDFYEVVRQLEARPEFVEIASLSIRKFGNKNIATGDFEISFYALDPEKMKSKNRLPLEEVRILRGGKNLDDWLIRGLAIETNQTRAVLPIARRLLIIP